MTQVRVICKNHGVIKTIEMSCMWVGQPPNPEVAFRHCPLCGERTVIEQDEETIGHWSYSRKDSDEIKRKEVEYYKKKYWGKE